MTQVFTKLVLEPDPSSRAFVEIRNLQKKMESHGLGHVFGMQPFVELCALDKIPGFEDMHQLRLVLKTLPQWSFSGTVLTGDMPLAFTYLGLKHQDGVAARAMSACLDLINHHMNPAILALKPRLALAWNQGSRTLTDMQDMSFPEILMDKVKLSCQVTRYSSCSGASTLEVDYLFGLSFKFTKDFP